MGSVWSAGKDKDKDKNAVVRRKKKLKKLKSYVNQKGTLRTSDHIKKKKKQYPEFSSEFKISNPNAKGTKLVSQRGSFLGRASERAVEVLDTLGNMSKINTSNGFGSGMVSRGNTISILAFEVANTINKGAILFHSLSEENIRFLKKEILQSEGLHQLVSTDTKELISFLEADKREEFNVFSREVARFGNMCKDPQWHNLDRYFSRLDLDVLDIKQTRVEAEKTMQDLAALARNTAELYHELNSLDRFERDYQQKVKEMESLNLPLTGESLVAFQIELKHQRKLVRSLQKKSLWAKNFEEITEKLVDIVTHIHHAISEFLGNYGSTTVKYSEDSSQRLGEAGLALHYANIINQINMIATRPAVLPPNMRDTLYHTLPNNIKSALSSKLKNVDITKELSITQVKAKIDKSLKWLLPFATNTTKVHQGFGWIVEWANTSNDLGEEKSRESNPIRLQTLHYVNKQKIDFYIIELLAQIHHLVSFVRYRHNVIRSMPTRASPKSLDFQSKMLQFISLDHTSKPLRIQISEEDRELLEKVTMRRMNPGISKSENLVMNKEKEVRILHSTKSVGSSPLATMALKH